MIILNEAITHNATKNKHVFMMVKLREKIILILSQC